MKVIWKNFEERYNEFANNCKDAIGAAAMMDADYYAMKTYNLADSKTLSAARRYIDEYKRENNIFGAKCN